MIIEETLNDKWQMTTAWHISVFSSVILYLSCSIIAKYSTGSHRYIAEVNGQCEMRDEQ
jgi:hypothetical protein